MSVKHGHKEVCAFMRESVSPPTMQCRMHHGAVDKLMNFLAGGKYSGSYEASNFSSGKP